MVMEEWQCGGSGGRDSECTGGLAGQNAAAGPTTARAQAHHLSHLPLQQSWSPPLHLSTEIFSVLLLLTVKYD